MTRRGMVKEVVYGSGPGHYDLDDQPLDIFICYLKDIVESTPEEYRDGLRIDFVETCGYDARIAIMVYYERPETIEELAARYEGIGKINARQKQLAESGRAGGGPLPGTGYR